jgi:hypothetical protein
MHLLQNLCHKKKSVTSVGVSAGECLFVVLPYFNYCRYQRRLQLFTEFVQRYVGSGSGKLKLVVVEGTIKGEAFQLPSLPGVFLHIKVELPDQVWIKENLINLGVKHLPSGWRYMAWIDADITFLNLGWVNETIRVLGVGKAGVAQLFQTAINMGPEEEAMKIDHSFCYMALKSNRPYHKNAKYGFWHPGFAWAMTRETYERIGGLLDCAILGSGDRHMALSLIGKGAWSYHGGVTEGYKEKVRLFEEKLLGVKFDYVPGTVLHHFHGSLKDRQYVDRWLILVRHKYDPFKDIYYDRNGLLKLNGEGRRMQEEIRGYFMGRREDGKIA